MSAKDRKWTDEQRARHSELQKRLKAIAREKRNNPGGTGGSDRDDNPSGDAGLGDRGDGDRGDASGEPRLGTNLIASAKSPKSANPGEQTEKGKPRIISVPWIVAGLPWFIKKVNITVNGILKFVTGGDRFKVLVYLEPVEEAEAKMDAEMLRPSVEDFMPMWLENHKILAAFLVFLGNTFGKLRWKKKEVAKDGDKKDAKPTAGN